MPAIIDTTVWIDFFRDAKTEETDLLEVVIRRGDAALGDVIVSEVLQGIDSDRESRDDLCRPRSRAGLERFVGFDSERLQLCRGKIEGVYETGSIRKSSQ